MRRRWCAWASSRRHRDLRSNRGDISVMFAGQSFERKLQDFMMAAREQGVQALRQWSSPCTRASSQVSAGCTLHSALATG